MTDQAIKLAIHVPEAGPQLVDVDLAALDLWLPGDAARVCEAIRKAITEVRAKMAQVAQDKCDEWGEPIGGSHGKG